MGGMLLSWLLKGGLLSILLCGLVVAPALAQEEPPEFELALAIEEVALDQGAVRVVGTVTCSQPVEDVNVLVVATQPVVRIYAVRGFGSTIIACANEASFTVLVIPQNGRFGRGTAFINASAFACLELENSFSPCDEAHTVTIVQLRPVQE
jgi:hypothetical protein